MNSTPFRVSIIIRTKDRPEYLKAAVLSVIKQSYRPLELVVVNDGGSDVRDLLKSTLPTDDQISLLYQAIVKSLGRADAANEGLRLATGQCCLFLDDDDYLDADHVETLVQAYLEHCCQTDEPVAVHCQARAVEISEESGSERSLSIQGSALQTNQLYYQNQLPILTVLFPTKLRELGIAFDPAFDLFEDWDFWLQVQQVCEFHFIEQVTCAYRIHPQSSGVREQEKRLSAFSQIYHKWLVKLSPSALSQTLALSHAWHDLAIDKLQQANQQNLNHIGQLHSHALEVIQSKDNDIEHLTHIYQDMELRLQTLQEKHLETEAALAFYQKNYLFIRRTSLFYFLKCIYKFSRTIIKKLTGYKH